MNKARGAASDKSKVQVYRNAVTGDFVSRSYAHAHPDTTEVISNPHEVILDGVRQVNKATEKQISEIDRMILKYGL